jgi:hypothetical protein
VPINIKLKKYEIEMASQVGLRRWVESYTRGHKNKHGLRGLGLDVSIVGAIAEAAAARALNMYWDGSVNTFKQPDIMPNIEIRWTGMEPPALIHRGADSEDRLFVLVTGQPNDMTIHGFLEGSECRQKKWLKAPHGRPPAWFVPHTELKPASKIVKAVAKNTST